MVPTAEEFLQDSFTISHFYNDKYDRMSCFSDDVQQAMIEFAKLHVEAALKEASKKAKVRIIQGDFGVFDTRPSVKKNSILNAYPLENIK